MSEQPQARQDGTEVAAQNAPTVPGVVVAAPQAPAAPAAPGQAGPTPAALSPLASATSSVFADEHPERAVGAAFAGGLVLALILKRLAR